MATGIYMSAWVCAYLTEEPLHSPLRVNSKFNLNLHITKEIKISIKNIQDKRKSFLDTKLTI